MRPELDARPALRLHRLGAGPALPPPSEMLTFLDRVERLRADRYAAPARAAHFVTGRYLLRLFAADLLDAEPRALVPDFECPVCARPDARSDHGRPGYLLDGDRVPLALSLSRAAGTVLLGALDLRDPHGTGALRGATERGTTEAGIGVDIDALGGVVFEGFDDVALSQAERDRVAIMPRRLQDGERARLWVRKEALVKARGTGFGAVGPADVDVLADPGITDLEEYDGVILARLGLVAAVAVLPAER